MKKLKRMILIVLKVGMMSPSLGTRVKFSDIWKTPYYGG